MFDDDVIISLADTVIGHCKTYGEAVRLVEAVRVEISRRAMEQEV
ncbi:hypothetical protein ABQH43_01485 [Streptococcus sp. ZJ100]